MLDLFLINNNNNYYYKKVIQLLKCSRFPTASNAKKLNYHAHTIAKNAISIIIFVSYIIIYIYIYIIIFI